MKIGEIWKMKPESIERIRQDFIEMDGDDSDFSTTVDSRVRITKLYDDRIDYDGLDGILGVDGEYVVDFLKEYEKVYE